MTQVTRRAIYAAAADHPEAVPGMIGAIQTFGDLVYWHPHREDSAALRLMGGGARVGIRQSLRTA